MGGGSDYGYGGGYGGMDGGENASIASKTFADYLNWLKRYAWIAVLTTVTGTFYGFYLFTITPKTYQSWTSIQIARVKQEAADVAEEERIRLGVPAELQATLEKLRMPRIYQNVAANPLFANRPEVLPLSRRYVLPWEPFLAKKTEPAAADGAKPEVSAGAKPEVSAGAKPEVSAGAKPEVSAGALAGMMAGWVSVSVRENTNLVDIFATHTNPEVARDVLASLLTEYEKLTAESIAGSEENTLNYIVEKCRELQEGVLKIESSLARYQGCVDLSKRIETTRISIIEMEKRYLPKWPDLIEAKELLSLLRKRFAEELTQVIGGSPEEQKFWQENAAGSNGLEGEALIAAQLRTVASRASILSKALETEQGILENLNMKLKEADVTRGIATRQFDIIQPPTLPGAPIAPSLNDVVGRFAGGGFLLGIACIFLIGFLDPSIRTVGELERDARLPVIGAVPSSTSRGDGVKRELVLLTRKDPHAAEAIRTLRTGLTLLGDSEERRIFVITSSLPGEGKSWISANLAVGFAQQGERTVLVDADLRKGVLHSTFNLSRDAPGVTNLLSKTNSLAEVIHQTEVENLWFIPSGGKSANPAELLGGRHLAAFLAELSQDFDRVVFDTAPLVPVSDTLPIAKRAQSVIMVYRMGKTPRKALFRAMKTLRANHAEPVGIVANQLPRVAGRGAYGYYYGYHGGGAIDGYASGDSR
jgi:capsular exopolysaccharide synthesis family protein